MKKRSWLLIICAMLVVTTTGCESIFQPSVQTPPPTDIPTDAKNLASQWQEDIDALRELRGKLPEAPGMMKGELPEPKPDLMAIFATLDHLTVKEGWVLDYAYNADGMGSYPILYARQADVEPISAEELKTQTSDPSNQEIQPGISADYLAYVVPDGSEVGYLQLAQLEIMGAQFYQGWHALYNDHTPIASMEGLSGLIKELGDSSFGFVLSNDEKKAAEAIEFSPTVEISDGFVDVRFVTFSKWGGFSEQKVKITLDAPQKLTPEEPVILVPYNSGLMF